MPEIAEVSRIVHFLQQSLVGKTLSVVKAQDDANVFGKVGTSAAEVEKHLTGKKVLDAGQQGKYFWLIMSSPPHLVMHFGMTGWIYIRGAAPTMHYRPKNEAEEEVWPPKYVKLLLETKESPKVDAAFTDPRRFARIRLVECAAEDIRQTSPLRENGPDPVIDKDLFTEEWFEKKMRSKHVPVKALLLDQANISGIGNWVGDEVLYNAKLHPEQYSDTFSTEQIKRLYESIVYVCQTAVDALGDSSQFPDDWLFNHRWGKGKKDAPTCLPTGEKMVFLKVGGRTSCVVPSVQKKTGAVAGDLQVKAKANASEEENELEENITKKRNAVKEERSEHFEARLTIRKKRKAGKEKEAENMAVEAAISSITTEAKDGIANTVNARSLLNGQAKKPHAAERPETAGTDHDVKLTTGRRRSGRVAQK